MFVAKTPRDITSSQASCAERASCHKASMAVVSVSSPVMRRLCWQNFDSQLPSRLWILDGNYSSGDCSILEHSPWTHSRWEFYWKFIIFMGHSMGIWSDSWCSQHWLGKSAGTPRFGVEQCDNDAWRFPIYNSPGLTHVLEMLGSLLQSNLIKGFTGESGPLNLKPPTLSIKKGPQKKPNHWSQIIWEIYVELLHGPG